MIPKTLVVKVGTSTLTGADGGIDAAYIQELAAELAALAHAGQRVVLVSSGAVRAGCERLGWAARPRTVPMKQAAAAVGQGRLMEIYASAFGRHGLAVGQLLLTRHDASDRTRYVNARNTLSTLLRQAVVPIINENDTVAVEEIRFGDNDTLAAQAAVMAHAELLLLLTDVDGLMDPEGNVIPTVVEVDHAVRALCTGAGARGTGGMTTKLAAAEIASAAGIRTCIARGRPASIARRIGSGEVLGTQFLPTTRRLAGRKHWIAYGSTPQGSLSVHPLAEAALVEKQKSLLPAGVVGVVGDFRRGETVTLTDAAGSQFARGIVSCDAGEVRAVMGLHTTEARGRIGRSDFQEIIHRDNLVLLPRTVPTDGHVPLP
jgi:glutamate 5-kinase